MAAPTIAANNSAIADSDQPSVSVPAGITDGDYLVICLSKDDDDTATSAPTGFTHQSGLSGQGVSWEHRIFTKASASSESGTYQLGASFGAAEPTIFTVVAINDHGGLDVSGYADADDTSVTVSALTVTSNDSLAVAFVTCEEVDSVATPSGWTELYDQTTGGGTTGAGQAVFYRTFTSGSTGNMTFAYDTATDGIAASVLVFAPSGGTNYTLTANTGSFTLTGVAAGLVADSNITASVGSFTLTGNAANFPVDRPITANTGSFTLTGQDALFNNDYALACTVGTFTLTGIDAALNTSGNQTLTADAGAFTLTGIDAALSYGTALTANAGAFSLSGIDVSLPVDRALTASVGSFTLTGIDAALTVSGDVTLTADVGNFSLTGNAATLSSSQVVEQPSGGGGFFVGQAPSKKKKEKREEIEDIIEDVLEDSAPDESLSLEQKTKELQRLEFERQALKEYYSKKSEIAGYEALYDIAVSEIEGDIKLYKKFIEEEEEAAALLLLVL